MHTPPSPPRGLHAALRFWQSFGPERGAVLGQPCWRLRDDLRELRLVQCGEQLTLHQRWTGGHQQREPVATVRALRAALTPPGGLNTPALSSGTVLSPVGPLRFSVRLSTSRGGERRLSLLLMTPPGSRPLHCAGSPDWLQYALSDPPHSHAAPPLSVTRAGAGHTEPAEGLRARMHGLSRACWAALVTPDLCRNLTLGALHAELAEARRQEAEALRDVQYWQRAAGP